ncbi:MAG: arylesterase [Rhizobiales bacterium]|nr:arylesterase [Hyphomicrobiales bacterium]
MLSRHLFVIVFLIWAGLNPTATWAGETLRIIAYGDSLSAGFGLPQNDTFPSQLEAALRARGHDVSIINAGVSGDTATSGLARLDWTLSDPADGIPADGIIVELGANDALRGIDPAITRAALDKILLQLKTRNMAILIAGMRAPLNMGKAYAAIFDPIYPDLAEDYEILLYPFFLDGVAGSAELNQMDGIHPSAAGVALIVERMVPSVELLIAEIEAKR